MNLNFVNNPAQAVENIQKVLTGEKIQGYNSYLGQILHVLGYEDVEGVTQMEKAAQNIKEISEFLKTNDTKIKEEFEKSSPIIQ